MESLEKVFFYDFLKKVFGDNIDVNLSDESKELIKSYTRIIRLNKGEFLQIEGDVSRYWGYVSEGLVRMYYLQHDKEITEQLALEGDGFLDYDSFFNQSPSRRFIQMLEPSTLYLFPRLECEELCNTNMEIRRFFRLMTELVLVLKKKRISDTIFKSAKERYQILLNEKPNLVLRVPSIYVASYLGITPETLSRIRSGVK
ncbi:MAG: Crp/Fnr family transcriptional regulator [Paludibacteraceae bacterium]|nr:Crp/Fnr family transcriptional regulator [Paludibacteraceae bacterium]